MDARMLIVAHCSALPRQVYKHSKGAVLLMVYNPKNQELYQWTLARDTLRELLENALGGGALSLQELYIKPHLSVLADKVMYRKRQGQRVVIVSKKGFGERGARLLIEGVSISANATATEGPTRIHHVVSIYEYHGDYIFRAYEPISTRVKVVRLTGAQLKAWFEYDPADSDVPPLLRLENRPRLLRWFLSRMFICRACGLRSHRGRHGRGEDILMLEYEVEEQRLHSMATKLQGMWRSRKCLQYIRRMVRAVVKKQWDPSSQQWYYMNKRTGEVNWSKPAMPVEHSPNTHAQLQKGCILHPRAVYSLARNVCGVFVAGWDRRSSTTRPTGGRSSARTTAPRTITTR